MDIARHGIWSNVLQVSGILTHYRLFHKKTAIFVRQSEMARYLIWMSFNFIANSWQTIEYNMIASKPCQLFSCQTFRVLMIQNALNEILFWSYSLLRWLYLCFLDICWENKSTLNHLKRCFSTRSAGICVDVHHISIEFASEAVHMRRWIVLGCAISVDVLKKKLDKDT